MNEFRSPTEVTSGPLQSIGQLSSKGWFLGLMILCLEMIFELNLAIILVVQILFIDLGNQDTADRNIEISWSRRHHSTNLGSPVNSPTKRGSDSSKHSRRRRSKDGSMGSPARDSSGSSRHSRRQQKSKLGPESSNQDHPAIPKSSRRKKGSTDGGSTKSSRSSRSKGQNSLSDIQFLDLGAVSESGNK